MRGKGGDSLTLCSKLRDFVQTADVCACERRQLSKSELARRRWDAEHLRTASTRLTVDEARRFKLFCENHDTTRYEVLRLMVQCLLQRAGY